MSGSGSSGVYTGTVTATVTDADNAGGSGVASVNYVLDGGPTLAYTVPVNVTTPGAHTFSVVVTDDQGNSGNASTSWTIQSNGHHGADHLHQPGRQPDLPGQLQRFGHRHRHGGRRGGRVRPQVDDVHLGRRGASAYTTPVTVTTAGPTPSP